MKIEVRKVKYPTSVTAYGEELYEIYITRRQFMSEYEADIDQCVEDLQTIAEMYTSPHCFASVPSKAVIDGIYRYFSEHKSAKGLVFQIIDKEDGCNFDLGLYVAKG